jgi:phytoene/squalene synthetase
MVALRPADVGDRIAFHLQVIARAIDALPDERRVADAMLERAATLGRAMQVTNIARDVGEDWDRGRLHLPRPMLARYGVTEDDIGAMRAGRRPIADAYRALLEDLMRPGRVRGHSRGSAVGTATTTFASAR